jgi:hypothetical protein
LIPIAGGQFPVAWKLIIKFSLVHDEATKPRCDQFQLLTDIMLLDPAEPVRAITGFTPAPVVVAVTGPGSSSSTTAKSRWQSPRVDWFPMFQSF